MFYKECKLHVALHGCVQQREKIGNIYAANSGYNQVADLNDLVVLYPQAKSSTTQMNRNKKILFEQKALIKVKLNFIMLQALNSICSHQYFKS